MKQPYAQFLTPRSSAAGIVVSEVNFPETMGSTGPFSASVFSVEMNCHSRVDSHQSHECWMVAQGEGTVVFEDSEFKLTPNDVVYFPPFSKHQAVNYGPDTLIIFSIWWK